MGRSRGRGTGRIIAAGWDGAEDEDVPYDARREPSAPSPARDGRAGTPTHRRRWWPAGGIAALLVLVLVLPSVLVGQRSPETEARSFLQAILDADTDTVREHMAPPEDGALDVGLTDQVLLAATARADSFTLEGTQIRGDHAEVTASLGLGRRTEEVTLHLTRHGTGVLRRPVWELDPVAVPILRVLLPVSATSVLLNGVEVDLPPGARSDEFLGTGEVRLALLPGVYEVSAPEGGPAVTPVTTRASLPPLLDAWTTGPIDLSYELTEEGVEQVDALASELLADCVQSTSPHPESCPFTAPEHVTANGEWEVLTPPSLHALSGQMGTYEFVALDGVAEFTVRGGGGEEAVHRVPVEGTGFAMMRRDEQMVGGWFQEGGGVVF